MSYKTNPILNRIKINKGWKNPSFPTKTLNYTRDFALWFKVYLLLKTFLNFKGIQLLSCEIRFDQQNQKILYLFINKKWTKKKEKRKKTNIQRRIQSPLRKNANKNAIFFLYQNQALMQNMSFWKQNFAQQKVLSKFWLTKPKSSTWLNTLKKIQTVRQNSLQKIQNWKKKKKFPSFVNPEIQFFAKKQKQLLASLARIKKINSFLYIKIFQLTQEKKSHILRSFIKNIQTKIQKNLTSIQKIQRSYNFLFLSKKTLAEKKMRASTYNLALKKIQKHKWKFLLKTLKNATKSFHRIRILKSQLPNLSLKMQEQIFSKIHDYRWSFVKRELLLKKILNLNFFFGQIKNKNWLLENYFLMLDWTTKARIKEKNSSLLKKNSFAKDIFFKFFFPAKIAQGWKKIPLKKNFYQVFLWRELRRKKQKTFEKKIKKRKKILRMRRAKKMKYKKYRLFLKNQKFLKKRNRIFIAKNVKKSNRFLKKNKIAKYYQYRIPYRRNYFNFLRLNTHFHLKYLIQDFVKNYFSLQVEAKILHSFNDYRNKKYFRLVFPLLKKKKPHLLKKYRPKSWKQKQIFLATQLQLITPTQKPSLISKKKFKKFEIRELTKKKSNLLTQKKKKQRRIQNKFGRMKGYKDFRQSFKYFIPTFLQFAQTLDPQLLVNILSKVLKMAKKQTWALNSFKNILQALNLPKNVGYRVALAGRINSKKKSRVIYFARKNNPLQVFKKNMNFAFGQANARIGTFGIKIWIYF